MKFNKLYNNIVSSEMITTYDESKLNEMTPEALVDVISDFIAYQSSDAFVEHAANIGVTYADMLYEEVKILLLEENQSSKVLIETYLNLVKKYKK